MCYKANKQVKDQATAHSKQTIKFQQIVLLYES